MPQVPESNNTIVTPTVDMEYLPADKRGKVTMKDLIEMRAAVAVANKDKDTFKTDNADVLNAKSDHDENTRNADRALRALLGEYVRMCQGVSPDDKANDQPVILPSMLDFDADTLVEYDHAEMLAWCIQYMPAVLDIKTALLETMLRSVLTLSAARYDFPTPPPARIVRAISPKISTLKSMTFKSVDERDGLRMLGMLHDEIQDMPALLEFVTKNAPELLAHFEAYALQNASDPSPLTAAESQGEYYNDDHRQEVHDKTERNQAFKAIRELHKGIIDTADLRQAVKTYKPEYIDYVSLYLKADDYGQYRLGTDTHLADEPADIDPPSDKEPDPPF